MLNFRLSHLLWIIVFALLFVVGPPAKAQQSDPLVTIPPGYDQFGYIDSVYFQPDEDQVWDQQSALGFAVRNSETEEILAAQNINDTIVWTSGYTRALWYDWDGSLWFDLWLENVPEPRTRVTYTEGVFSLASISEDEYNPQIFAYSHVIESGDDPIYEILLKVNFSTDIIYSAVDGHNLESWNSEGNQLTVIDIYEGELLNQVVHGTTSSVIVETRDDGLIRQRGTVSIEPLPDIFEITSLIPNHFAPGWTWQFQLDGCDIIFNATLDNANVTYISNRDNEVIALNNERVHLPTAYEGLLFEIFQVSSPFDILLGRFSATVIDDNTLLAWYMTSKSCW